MKIKDYFLVQLRLLTYYLYGPPVFQIDHFIPSQFTLSPKYINTVNEILIWTLYNEHACTSSITANVTSGGNSDPSARNWAQLILLAAIFNSKSYFKSNDCQQSRWLADNPYLSVLQSSNNECHSRTIGRNIWQIRHFLFRIWKFVHRNSEFLHQESSSASVLITEQLRIGIMLNFFLLDFSLNVRHVLLVGQN